MADRELIGKDWFDFLNKNNIKYYIRLRNNFKVFCFDKNEEKPVFWLFNKLKMAEFYHHPKIEKIKGVLCYVSGIKTISKEGRIDFLIIISISKPEASLILYKKDGKLRRCLKLLRVVVLILKILM